MNHSQRVQVVLDMHDTPAFQAQSAQIGKVAMNGFIFWTVVGCWLGDGSPDAFLALFVLVGIFVAPMLMAITSFVMCYVVVTTDASPAAQVFAVLWCWAYRAAMAAGVVFICMENW